MNNTPSKCPTVLLADGPATEDAFGHAAIADAIAELISSEPGGKCIGITGPWGSGKSTVVELVRSRIRDGAPKDTDIFVFDAWAHQGDPLRRTLLERLIRHLIDRNWLAGQEDSWRRRLEELARRREVISSQSHPVLTKWGGVFTLSLALLPFGASLAAAYITKYDSDKYWGYAGLAIAAMPFLLACLALGHHYLKTWKLPTNQRDPFSLAALFSNRSTEQIQSTTVHTPDPTSIEFQDLFADLVDAVLTFPNRKLVIVIDNLDRVDADDALKIWSTLRTFFDFRAYADSAKLNRVWVVLPFDSTAIRKLWNGEPGSSWDGSLGDVPPEQSFIDKTFQIVFRVPRVVLSHWDTFFRREFHVAFPAHSEEDAHRVIRVFDVCVVRGGQPPTPRDIKLFINAVGAIHRRWQDRIPVSVMALYAGLARTERNLLADLAGANEAELIGSLSIDVIGPEWRQNLAAIQFNVEPEIAIQVLISPRILSAIRSGDPAQLESIVGVPGFLRVLEQVIERNGQQWSSHESRTVLNAARCVDSLPDCKDHGWSRIWSLIFRAAEQIRSLSPLLQTDTAGIMCLLRRNPGLGRQMVSAISGSQIEAGDGKVSSDEAIDTWLRVASETLAALPEERRDEIARTLRVPGTAVTYLRLAAMASTHEEFWHMQSYLRPKESLKTVLSELASRASRGNFDWDCAAAAETMYFTRQQWPWPDLVSAFNPRLRQTGVLPTNELRSLLFVLNILPGVKEAKQLLQELSQQGYLQHHLGAAAADDDAAAEAVWSLLETRPEPNLQQAVTQHSHVGQNVFNEVSRAPQSRPKIVEKVAEFVWVYRNIAYLYKWGAAHPHVQPLIDEILRKFAARSDITDRIDAKAVVQQHALFARVLGSGFGEFVQRMVRESSLVGEIAKSEFDNAMLELYLHAYRGAREQADLAKFLSDAFGKVEKQSFLESMRSEDAKLELVLMLGSDGQLQLSTAFGDALVEHAGEVLRGSAKVTKFQSEWPRLLSVLDETTRIMTLRRILDRVAGASTTTESVLALYGPALTAPNVIGPQIERVVAHAFKNMVERCNGAELRWVQSVLTQNDDLLNRVTPEARADFRARVVDAASRDDVTDEVRSAIVDMSKVIGARLKGKSQAKGTSQ